MEITRVMKYALTDSRNYNCDCYQCDQPIGQSDRAYTSCKLRKFCFSCGYMENQYADKGMERPVK